MVQCHSSEGNYTRDTSAIKSKINLKSLKFHSNLPGAIELIDSTVTPVNELGEQGPLLLTWFNFNPSMDK